MAIPNCRLAPMVTYHLMSPALSTEEAGLMSYLQSPPDGGPAVNQAIAGLHNWKCAGRRLVQIGGNCPLSTAGHSMISSERPSPEAFLKKAAHPAVLGGENSGNALEASNALNYRVLGIPAVLSRGIPGNALRAFPGSFRNFPEFLQESPRNTGGVA